MTLSGSPAVAVADATEIFAIDRPAHLATIGSPAVVSWGQRSNAFDYFVHLYRPKDEFRLRFGPYAGPEASLDLGELGSGVYDLHVEAKPVSGDDSSRRVTDTRTVFFAPTDEARSLESIAQHVPGGRERIPVPAAITAPEPGEAFAGVARIAWAGGDEGAVYDVFLRHDETDVYSRKLDIEGTETPFDVSDLPTGTYTCWIRSRFAEGAFSFPKVWSQPVALEIAGSGDEAGRMNAARLRAVSARARAAHDEQEAFFRDAADMSYEDNIEMLRGHLRNGDTYLRSFPIRLGVQLGLNCNIDCIHCDNGRVNRNELAPDILVRDLVENNWLRFLDELSIDGGEPLMFSGFRALVEKSYEFDRLKLLTNTNGTLIDEFFARAFAEKFSKVWISLDATNRRSYELIRRKGDFDQLIRNIELIHRFRSGAGRGEDGVEIGIIMLLNRLNYTEIEDMMELAHRLNAQSVIFKNTLVYAPRRNYAGMEFLELTHDRAACERVLADLENAEALGERYGIMVYERVRGYLYNRYPDLAQLHGRTQFLRHSHSVDDAIENADNFEREAVLAAIRRGGDAAPAGPPAASGTPDGDDDSADPAVRRANVMALAENVALPEDMRKRSQSYAGIGDDDYLERVARFVKRKVAERNLVGEGFFCDVPFTQLSFSPFAARMCCFATQDFTPIHLKKEWSSLHDVWNGERFRTMRGHMLDRRINTICSVSCPIYSGNGWISRAVVRPDLD